MPTARSTFPPGQTNDADFGTSLNQLANESRAKHFIVGMGDHNGDPARRRNVLEAADHGTVWLTAEAPYPLIKPSFHPRRFKRFRRKCAAERLRWQVRGRKVGGHELEEFPGEARPSHFGYSDLKTGSEIQASRGVLEEGDDSRYSFRFTTKLEFRHRYDLPGSAAIGDHHHATMSCHLGNRDTECFHPAGMDPKRTGREKSAFGFPVEVAGLIDPLMVGSEREDRLRIGALIKSPDEFQGHRVSLLPDRREDADDSLNFLFWRNPTEASETPWIPICFFR